MNVWSVCMHVYVCGCVYAFTISEGVHICMHVLYVHMCICILWVYMCVCTYVCGHVYVRMLMCVYMYMCGCSCVYACMCVGVHVETKEQLAGLDSLLQTCESWNSHSGH